MTIATRQFRTTSLLLMGDISAGLGRDVKDAAWVGGFLVPSIGSFGHECGGFDKLEEGSPTVKGSLGGISFPQWTGMSATGRRKRFMDFCRAHKLHPYGYEAACGFILYELTGSARSVVAATLAAPPLSPEGLGWPADYPLHTIDRQALGRIVMFERMYEGAGVKHYPSRYNYAMAAMAAYCDWARDGFPAPGKYVMPRARFTVAFDREFGRGETEKTTRWDTVPPAALANPTIADLLSKGGEKEVRALPDGRIQISGGANTVTIITPGKGPRSQAWPEDALSSAEVMAVQKRLRELGYVRVGVIDGKWGPSTRASIVTLQAQAGLPTDGHYTPETRDALMRGVRRVVPPERAQATATALLAAGEPTLAAVQPISIASKVLAVGSSLGAAVAGVATVWPQASQTIDGLRATFGDLPGWIWPLLVLAVSVYLYLSTRQVKAVAVDNFRTGASTALATPLTPPAADAGAVLPPVPQGSAVAEALSDVGRGLTMRAPSPDVTPAAEVTPEAVGFSEPDRPLDVPLDPPPGVVQGPVVPAPWADRVTGA